jgi:hypothetical protein
MYNLAGELVEDGLKKIGAIKCDNDEKHGRITLIVEPLDGFPFRFSDAVILFSEPRPDRPRKRRKARAADIVEPVYDGPAHCIRCGWQSSDRKAHGQLVDVPHYNYRGHMFECPQCSSTQLEAAKNYVHFDPKSIPHRDIKKSERIPKSLLATD